jgi:hypothetical protein
VTAAAAPNLLEAIKVDSLRVGAPTDVVFLCGGAIDENIDPPKMLRDAFYRVSKRIPPPYQIVLAEDAEPLTADAGYNDLLSFESDVAQVVGLILLFAESAGSLAELGAFSALDTVAPRLLAVLCNKHYEDSSFIRNGPVRFLEAKFGDESIHVLDCEEMGLNDSGQILDLDAAAFITSIQDVIKSRLTKNYGHVKFKPDIAGHIILMIVGLCFEYGALTQQEIRDNLKFLGVKEIRFDNFIYCALLMGWIKRVRKGNHVFYVSTSPQSAILFNFAEVGPYKDKIRWRADLRAYWKGKDSGRLKAISEAFDGGPA